MSFMFHPYPYVDKQAVNTISLPCEISADLTVGSVEVSRRLAKAIAAGSRRIGIDGYPGTEFDTIRNTLAQYIPADTTWIDGESVTLDADVFAKKISHCLPMDRTDDPVLLYGRRYLDGIESLQDDAKVEKLKARIKSSTTPLIVIGRGTLSKKLRDAFDLKIWIDVTPRTAAINFKYGKARNLAATEDMPFNMIMRRNYYVDYENAVNLRWELVKQDAIDWYMTADDTLKLTCMTWKHVKAVFDEVRKKPLRARPVYLEGVWGGFYFMHLRNLPKTMHNCAWIFDLIPMEVSLAAVFDGKELEVPFFTFVQEQGEKLLGKQAMDTFHGYFPVRFNYDDTWHSNGNMSVQCHPTQEYVVKNHDELGRQDESYYVCVTAQGARTYLGFVGKDSCKEFFKKAREAEKTGELIDYQHYINAVPSVPGTQVMIPAGTVHASGRNQVILEIGSLTIGSYTYKLYDYQRIDPQTLKPRPIHLNAGEKVIHPERVHEWVEQNLVNHGYVVREGVDKDGHPWQERVVGEHDLLYFSLRNLDFWTSIDDDTKGTFHVLSLVDGEKVRVESKKDPSKYYDLRMLDIVTVPSDFGPYRIVNLSRGEAVVHKTMLKEEKR